MMRKPVLIALVLALSGPSLFAQDTKPKILVVYLKKIIDESAEGKEFVGALKKRMADKKQEFAKNVDELKVQQQKLMEVELMNRDETWYKQVRAALEAQASLKVEEQFFIAKLNDQIARQINELLRGAQQEARSIMKARGADLVIISRMGPITINSDKELQDEIVFRRVLCAKDELDITDEVMKRMDEWYRKNKAKRGLPKREEETKKDDTSKKEDAEND
jgi:Skp family chaperone for outer membrane proteins